MTRDEVLKRLEQLGRDRPSFAIGNRPTFAAWATEAERLFVMTLPPSEPPLVQYKKALERYLEGTGDNLKLAQNVVGTFLTCKAALEGTPPGVIEARLVAGPTGGAPATPPTGIRLFISHRSTDAVLAEAVVKLLQSALGLPPSAIRATSVTGYRLSAGIDSDERLRAEVLGADVVVGLVSTASLQSLYVAFELGARWGRDPDGIVPLLAAGISPSEVGDPLGGKNALRADDRGQVQQLVTDVAKRMGITPQDPATYQKELEAVLACAAKTTTTQPKQAIVPASGAQGPPPPLPSGFVLRYGIVWDLRSAPVTAYCEGCRTGLGKWVAFAHVVTGPINAQMNTLTCPLGHGRTVLGPQQPIPLTAAQAAAQTATLERLLK